MAVLQLFQRHFGVIGVQDRLIRLLSVETATIVFLEAVLADPDDCVGRDGEGKSRQKLDWSSGGLPNGSIRTSRALAASGTCSRINSPLCGILPTTG